MIDIQQAMLTQQTVNKNTYKVCWKDIVSVAERVARKTQKNPGLTEEDIVQELAVHFTSKISAWDHCENADDAQRYAATVMSRKMIDIIRYHARRKDTSFAAYETETHKVEDYIEQGHSITTKSPNDKVDSKAELYSLMRIIEDFCAIMDQYGPDGRLYAESYMKCTVHAFAPWEELKETNSRCRNKEMPTPRQLFDLLSIPVEKRSYIETTFYRFMKEEYEYEG
jgi:DNA-directed RNA polymerase specialized sigma24 family protein